MKTQTNNYMKKLFMLALIGLFSGSGLTLRAQDFPGIDKSVMDMSYYPQRAAFRAFAKTEEERKSATPVMRVTYSRPLKNERDVFPDVVKYGEIWRVGANESTELMLFQDVELNGTRLEQGRYTLYAVVNEDNWEVHVSTDTDGWGQYAFKPEESTVAKITVPTRKTEETIEALGIYFEKMEEGSVHMVIGWDDTMVRVPFKV